MKKLVIIGCGGIGEYHLGHFLDYQDIELAGFCDLIPERADEFVKRAGRGKAYTDFRVMYDEIQPDMVFICIPPYAHGEIEFETIARGIPMFVEKPVALDLDLAIRIRDAVAAKGLTTAVGFQCRYSNIVEPSKQFIQSHPIHYVSCERMGGIPDTPWWSDRSLSGGQIVEQTVHQYDMIRYLLGEPETIFTLGERDLGDGVPVLKTEALSSTVVRFKNGVLGTISTGCYATDGACSDSKITFSARDARLDHYIIGKIQVYGVEKDVADDGSGFVIKGDGSLKATTQQANVVEDDGTAGVLCDRTFVDAVLTGDASKIRSPYAEGVRTLAFVLACNQSMDTKLPVQVVSC